MSGGITAGRISRHTTRITLQVNGHSHSIPVTVEYIQDSDLGSDKVRTTLVNAFCMGMVIPMEMLSSQQMDSICLEITAP